MIRDFLRLLRCLIFCTHLRCYFGGGSESDSSQSSSTSSSSQVNDSRVGVADDGVYASSGGSVDKSANDNRTFDDHSTFSLDASQTDASTNVDSRDFSDHSTFSVTDASTKDSGNTTTLTTNNTDSRNLSDNSTFGITNSGNTTSSNTTNYTSSDPQTLKELAAGAFSAAQLSTTKGSEMLASALQYGDAVTAKAIGASSSAVSAAIDTAKQSTAFAGDVVAKVVEQAKSADQQNTEKLVKAGTYLAGAALITYAAVKIFGKNKN